MHVLSLVGSGSLTCADSPNRFVGNNYLGEILGRKAEESLNLSANNGVVRAVFALLKHLANAEDRFQAVGQSHLHLCQKLLVVLAEILAALAMADDDVTGTCGSHHRGADFACVGTFVVLGAVLGAEANYILIYNSGNGAEMRCGHTNNYAAINLTPCEGFVDFLCQSDTFRYCGVHLPVAGYNLFSHSFYSF